jgi:hypothetical protein
MVDRFGMSTYDNQENTQNIQGFLNGIMDKPNEVRTLKFEFGGVKEVDGEIIPNDGTYTLQYTYDPSENEPILTAQLEQGQGSPIRESLSAACGVHAEMTIAFQKQVKHGHSFLYYEPRRSISLTGLSSIGAIFDDHEFTVGDGVFNSSFVDALSDSKHTTVIVNRGGLIVGLANKFIHKIASVKNMQMVKINKDDLPEGMSYAEYARGILRQKKG